MEESDDEIEKTDQVKWIYRLIDVGATVCDGVVE